MSLWRYNWYVMFTIPVKNTPRPGKRQRSQGCSGVGLSMYNAQDYTTQVNRQERMNE